MTDPDRAALVAWLRDVPVRPHHPYSLVGRRIAAADALDAAAAENAGLRREVEDMKETQERWEAGVTSIVEAQKAALAVDAARIATLEAENARLSEMVKSPWDDKPLPEDDAILAQHPMRSDDPGCHSRYAEAMRLVGARRGKYALVDLVNWLLAGKDILQAEVEEFEKYGKDTFERANERLNTKVDQLAIERDRLRERVAALEAALILADKLCSAACEVSNQSEEIPPEDDVLMHKYPFFCWIELHQTLNAFYEASVALKEPRT